MDRWRLYLAIRGTRSPSSLLNDPTASPIFFETFPLINLWMLVMTKDDKYETGTRESQNSRLISGAGE
jgi:hypothetical protein